MAPRPIHRPLLRRLSRRLTGGGSADVPGPVNTVAPAITYPEPFGLGDLLTCGNGSWTTLGTISGYTKQWRRQGVNIPGETGDTFEPEAADDDVSIFSCRVTATDEFGSRTRLSNSVGPFNLVDLSGGTLLFVGDDLAYSGDGITYNPE